MNSLLFPEIEYPKSEKVDQVFSCGESQNSIIESIINLHIPNGIECDASFGNGSFYKNKNIPKFCFDIDPKEEFVVKASSEMLPLESESVCSVMFDPPFLTYIKNGRKHADGSMLMANRFGGYYTYSELSDHYMHSISEFSRILKKRGHLVFKCQDIIHNHKLHSTHINVVNFCELEGFRLKDQFVLFAKNRLPRPAKGVQRHARINHSYFLVFQKWC